ncbi:hypothetical protein [Cedecea sp.]|uniref:hypothetical protein n=1 Tax=Cedecea sp. TaxID=1970739 RepID=UPI002F3F884B
MELKHTPGPWFVSPKSDVTVEGDLNVIQTHGSNVKGYHVAYCTTWTDSKETAEEAEANARIMAAAPELLEALRELVFASTYGIKNCTAQVKALEKANQVIAKATGH